MIGTGLREHFTEDRNTERGRLLYKAMAERRTLKGEAPSLTGRHVSYVMFPLGQGLGVFVRDVTDRRNAEKRREDAEEALRKRSAELEAVQETIPTAVWFTTDRELGYEIAGLSTHLDQAVTLARTAQFDFALLDINLNGRQSFPVADAVRARGLPFLFATGYGSGIVPEPYRDAPILQKPFSLEELRAALARADVA